MLQVFDFENNEIRFVGTDELPEWVASDVCDVFGIKNTADALSDFDDDEKGVATIDTLGGEQSVLTVTEAGLYRLIFKSRKPIAKRFKRWVVHEVLPSIRKNGGYVVPTVSSDKSPAQIAQQVIAEAEAVINWTVESLGIDETIGKQMKVDMVGNQLPHLKPSLEPIKKLIGASDPLESVGMNATQIGEHLTPIKKAKEVNDLLESMGLQYKVTRISTKTGKPKYFWQVTEEGQKHSVVHKVTNSNTDWNGNQIKWQKSVVKLIQEQIDSSAA
jgi:prophage antirepressor-like protein